MSVKKKQATRKGRPGITRIEAEFIQEFCKTRGRNEKEVRQLLSELKLFTKEYLLSGISPNESLPVMPSRILPFDLALGGFPRKITEIYGPPDGFKSAIVAHIGLNSDCDVLFMNAENKPFRWVVENDLLLAEGDYDASALLKETVDLGLTSLIIVDSLTALNRGVNTLKSMVKKMPANPELALIFINQTRDSRYSQKKEPAMHDEVHGLCSLIIGITEIESTVYGHRAHCRIDKPRNQVPFYISLNNEGNVSNELYLLDMALKESVVRRTGPTITFEGARYRMLELINDETATRKMWTILMRDRNLEYVNYMGRSLSNHSTGRGVSKELL